MSVQQQTPVNRYVGNGVTTVYATNYKALAKADVAAWIDGVAKTVDVDFTVSGLNQDSGFSVTWVVAPANGTNVVIARQSAKQRLADYQNLGDFNTPTVNPDFDNPILMIQELQEQASRALTLPITDSPTSLAGAALGSVDNRKGKYLFFNAITGAIEYALNLVTTALSQSIIGQLLFPQSDEETAAGVVPVNYFWTYGHPKRFGAVLNGVTDDTTALNKWAAVPGYHFFPNNKSALITASITPVSNSTFEFAKGATILTNTQNISLFDVASKTDVLIRGAKFKMTSAGVNPYAAGVKLTSCTECAVEHCEFDGMQWSGVMLNKSDRCRILNNYVHDALGSGSDSNDIVCYEDANFNLIQGNICNGGGSWHGILIQDPYTGNVPLKNLVIGNRIGAHAAYGIAVYMPNTADSCNSIVNNYIEGVTGSANTVLYGSGIYIVGFGASGTIISGNTVRNCCISTTGTTNGPAGISVAGLTSSGAPVIVSSNIVEGMTKYWSILAVTNVGVQVILANNAISHPTGNTTGEPLRCENSARTSVLGNSIICSTVSGRRGIMIYANGAVVVGDTVVSNNTVIGCGDASLEYAVASGGTFVRAVITGNNFSGAASSIRPMVLSTIAGGTVTANSSSATAASPLAVASCTNLRLANNFLTTTGSIGFSASGTCTGSYFDKTNSPGGLIENVGTGLICEQLGNAAPSSASSYARVGDRVEQSVPVVGQPKGWRCTVAGNPGTWVSEGNL